MSEESVNHPAHYGGADNPYEAIKGFEAWGLGFNLGNAVKYVSRGGKKEPRKLVEDSKKAAWYFLPHMDTRTEIRNFFVRNWLGRLIHE